MDSVRIITDSSVQFPQPSFPGRELVNVIPLSVKLSGSHGSTEIQKLVNLPVVVNSEHHPIVEPPDLEQFRSSFASNKNHSQSIGIFMSSGLSTCYQQACLALENQPGKYSIPLIDSLTTSVGLGILVQTAAKAAHDGAALIEIERLIRSQIQHIYSVICVPSLTFLHYSNLLDFAQAAAGEMLGLFPIFSLEEGRLTPQEKVRNHRHVIDYFQEFIDEFERLNNIALIQSYPPNPGEARLLRERAQINHNQSIFTEHTINLPLAVLLGPRSIGLFVVEPD